MFIKGKRKNWGEGIPSYSEDDLMNEDEIYDFALDIVDMYINKDMNIIDANQFLEELPSMVCKDKGELVFILVEGAIDPSRPKLTPIRKVELLNHASKFQAKCYYASVSFACCDEARCEKGLALRGDDFYALFEGLEEVKEENEIMSLEYQFRVLSKIGKGYETNNYDIFREYLADDCTWYSTWSGYRYNGIEEIDKYYYPKFDTIRKSNGKIKSRLAVFDGNMSRPFQSDVNIQGKIEKDQSCYVIQTDGKPTIFLEQFGGNKRNYMLIDVDFNNEGKITSISLVSPAIYKFKYFM